jgi:hypothetical protein
VLAALLARPDDRQATAFGNACVDFAFPGFGSGGSQSVCTKRRQECQRRGQRRDTKPAPDV